jgi:hypothetical protein
MKIIAQLWAGIMALAHHLIKNAAGQKIW